MRAFLQAQWPLETSKRTLSARVLQGVEQSGPSTQSPLARAIAPQRVSTILLRRFGDEQARKNKSSRSQ
jgi:hypothetical protein